MALIPPFFFDCVVAIGKADSAGARDWVATGFLYGDLKLESEGRKEFEVYLVSNRHVLETQEVMYLRFNPKGTMPAREYVFHLADPHINLPFGSHSDPEIDLAVSRINVPFLEKDKIQFSVFQSDTQVADRKTLEELGITEGDFAYVLGFPMGIVGEERSYVIARHGTIARIRDYLAGASNEILMDCMIFPGNSGGPVVIKPELAAIAGTKAPQSALLLGVVAGYIPYQDVAISQQTNRPRVVFEDNSGLASVVPVQYLIDLIRSLKTRPETERGDSNGGDSPRETNVSGIPPKLPLEKTD